MKIIFGIVIGVTATIALTYMVVSIIWAVSQLVEYAAKEEKKPIRDIISNRIYTFAAFIVVLFMVLNLLIIVFDHLTSL
nr:MAG TPA: hypothetical protein [Caudoviricetes sp.]